MKRDETIARIEHAASWYDSREDFDRVLIEYSWRRILRRTIGTSALELGSADGLMTEALAKHFSRVVVVEGVAKNVENLRLRWPNVEIHHSLFEEFDTEERFDNVIAARVLEHIPDPVPLLRKAASWCKPGGRVHVMVPNAESFHRRLGVAMGTLSRMDELHQRDRDSGHFRVYRRDTLTADIRAAGLEILEFTGTFIKPLSNAQMLSWEPAVLDGLFRLADDFPALSSEVYAVCTVPERE